MKRGVVVIPCHNEADNIGGIIRHIQEYLPDAITMVVDDGSTDNTIEAAIEAGVNCYVNSDKTDPQYGDGFIGGMATAAGLKPEYVIFFDAGNSYDPTELPRFLEAEARVVMGSRFVEGGKVEHTSWFRRQLTFIGRLVFTRLGGVGADYCGIRYFHHSVLASVFPLAAKFTTSRKAHIFNPQLNLLLCKARDDIVWVPVSYKNTNSTLKPWGVLEVAWHMLKILGRLW